MIATAIGRNSGSTMPSAASGNSVPSVSTADRNAGPVPGRGPRSVTASSTATSAGSASMSAMVAQVRRLRTQLDQLDADHGALRPHPEPVGALRRRREHDLLQGVPLGAEPRDPDPGLHQPRVERGGIRLADQEPLAVVLLHDAVEQPPDLLDVGRVHLDPAGGTAQLLELGLEDQPAPVQDADAGAELLDLAEQVAGEEHGGARPG